MLSPSLLGQIHPSKESTQLLNVADNTDAFESSFEAQDTDPCTLEEELAIFYSDNATLRNGIAELEQYQPPPKRIKHNEGPGPEAAPSSFSMI